MSGISINKFSRSGFGNLTTLTSKKTGKVMFIAKEVAELWGHSNSTKAVKDAELKSDEVLNISKNSYKEFFLQLSNQQLVGRRASSITLISESGLYKLALNSKKPEAAKLRDWVTSEVLPSIRKTGSYSVAPTSTNIEEHKKVSVQKSNSKVINRYNYENGGVEKIINYNIQSCILHTGKPPREIKEFGRSIGLKPTERLSAKEVLRRINPAMACCMSFTDNVVSKGAQLERTAQISRKLAMPLFKALIEEGITPLELTQ